jgi:hypothetical protein
VAGRQKVQRAPGDPRGPEALVVATLDPISATAERDGEELRAFLADVTVDDAGSSPSSENSPAMHRRPA